MKIPPGKFVKEFSDPLWNIFFEEDEDTTQMFSEEDEDGITVTILTEDPFGTSNVCSTHDEKIADYLLNVLNSSLKKHI